MYRALKSGIALSVVGCLVLSANVGMAQTGPAGRGGQGRVVRPPSRNYLPELKTIISDQAKKYNVKTLVDPTIFVPAMPKFTTDADSIDKAMDALVAQFKGTSWKRIYLTQAQGNTLPAADKIATAVRAMDEIQNAGLVLENPATKKASTVVKDYAVTPSFSQDLTANQFSSEPIYVFYAKVPMADAMTPEEKFMDLQKQQMEMLLNMSPDQMSQAMASGMQMITQMDPAVRQQFMGNMMRASMQMFQSMSAEDKNALLQSAMQAFQGGGFGQPGGGRPPK